MEKKAEQIVQTVKSNPKWLLFIFSVIVFGVAYLIAGHIFAEKPVVVPLDNRLYGFFSGKEHQKVIQQLDKFNKVVLVGNRKDGLYLFIDYYTSLKIKDGYLVKKRLFHAGQDLKYQKFPLLAIGYNAVHLQLFSKEPLPTLWLIETRSVLNTSDLDHLAAFAEAHPNHKIIVAANETTGGKDTKTFKKLKFDRPSEAEFAGLFKQAKLPNIISKNIIQYHNQSFEHLSYLVNMPNIGQAWANYFSDESENIKNLVANYSKADKILEALCESGSHPSKQIKAISPYNGAIVHEGKAYYWSSLKHVYAYSNKIGKACITQVKFIAAPEKPEVIVEQVTVEIPKPVQAEKKKPQTEPKPKAEKAEKVEKKPVKVQKKKKGK